MNDRHELERALRSLYQDAPGLPEDVMRKALEESAVTRQRRFGWLPVVRPGLPHGGMTLVSSAVAVLVVVVVGVVLVGMLSTSPESKVGPPFATASPTTSPNPVGTVIVVTEDGSGDAKTIADALELARDGDTIRIRPGTYMGGVTVSADVTIVGDGPRDEIVVIATARTPTIELDGTFAYAFLIDGSDAIIRELTLRNAGAARFAPAVAVGGAPTLERLDAGGTIWLTDGSDAIVRDNRIDGLSMSGELGDPVIGDNVTTSARDEVEQVLADQRSDLRCRPWREEDEPFTFGATGAVRCPDPAARVTQLAFFAFPDVATLERFWRWRLDDLGLDPDAGGRACGNGRQGVRSWRGGSIACYVPDEGGAVAKIRWTDTGDLVYGVMDATDADIGALYQRWQRLAQD